jgi:rubrerythrin
MTDEAEMIAERAHKLVEQIPTMKEAHGCMDCEHIFRFGAACPYCGGRSILNIASLLLGN